MTYRTEQDWEYAEEVSPGEWETVDIQIATEAEAIEDGQVHADRTGRRVSVTTSLAIIDVENHSVEDRDFAPGDPAPIILTPEGTP